MEISEKVRSTSPRRLTFQRGEVYAANLHVATYDNSKTYFDHTDWIGTERVRSAVNGTSFETCSSLPYGDNLLCQGSDPSPLHFTGKMRDTESGNDYFNARYLGSSMGRFLTPDPTGGHKEDPQTLNKYSYVLNNPLTLTDPTGLNPAPDQTCAVSTAVCYASGSNVSDTGDTFSAATPLFGTTNFAAWYATLPPQQQQAQQQMTTSAAGVAFIKGWEAWNGTVDKKTGLTYAKDDGFGNGTIGWGHKCGACTDFAGGITKAQGDALLTKDLGSFEGAVNGLGANLSQQQFDGLVAFAFNVRNFGGSTLFSNVASGSPVTEGNFTAYGNAHKNGVLVHVPSIYRRRESEWNVYANGVYDSSH